ncbi:uncharacterized protein LOC126899288 [Daktulosphaira vitifoliae]|uniref:uncharacterized protein LOC126899288 n=1 Tax=Daktulosphaira vitifoliae TaxID=58002 RepID=UPI0021AAD232|nr:uncharacterized protein LOC126899288 [Daktulosphaira vitifoliae]
MSYLYLLNIQVLLYSIIAISFILMSKNMFISNSEDQYSEILQRSLGDFLVKLGEGAIMVIGASLMLSRRIWPILFGMSYGAGIAFGNISSEISKNNLKVKNCKEN